MNNLFTSLSLVDDKKKKSPLKSLFRKSTVSLGDYSLNASNADIIGSQNLDSRDPLRKRVLSMADKKRSDSISLQRVADNDVVSLMYQNLTTMPALVISDQIAVLIFAGNKFTMIPNEVFEMRALTHLCMAFNELKSIATKIVELEHLCFLNLSGNLLRSEAINLVAWEQAKSLNTLLLIENQIDTFPRSLLNSKIASLSLAGNRLSVIPSDIGSFKLKWLGLSRNNIQCIDPLLSGTFFGITIESNPVKVDGGIVHAMSQICKVFVY